MASDLELTDNAEMVPVATLKEAREDLERQLVEQALQKHSGRISSAATELGISRPTLYELMDKLQINRRETGGQTTAASDKEPTSEGQRT
jgi:two-component system NtrC family response regulator